ncbi:arginine decarboxylase [Anaeromyxobacter sp. K]|uniref:Biosynthetic arginine decarboxylase n=1 Tax=Anaeromyxobacter dehalogenans (strain ATCC BAA-258 / DSM 21875 / 2CP-1) TaxID=455488 RepID=B8J8B0_ANAD2|nr:MULTISPECIES: biosynthetic arginine decarboxylase [Anaeromyxobacter]ACG73211.1 arginine decarboxylase [Anaeromyxobacter sp. K]ACL65409.1 arginine decarboxylase [Anaeromyxobacter dehalogenans 2CP-1]
MSIPEQRSDATTAMAAADWSIERAAQYYNVSGWGAGFFSINEKGHVAVHPMGQPGPTIDLMDVVEDIRERNIGFPCVVRFQDVLRARVKQINEAFGKAVAEMGYGASYFGVYPIKVNQMREVVDEIVDAGAPYHYGLEAGSKGELLVVLGMNADPDALTICNGYKDEEYLRLALLGRKLGRKVIVVIEKLSELPQLLRLGEEMGVDPMIGLRSKLTTRGTGKWEGSSGDFAKFGLTVPELIQAVRILKEAGKEHCAKLLHFHVGSQLTEIRVVKDAVNEGARVYAKLRKMGLPIEYFDVGGGLGVDYVGTRTNDFTSSVNYSMDEYVGDVVYNVQRVCMNEGVPEPHIVSESGRAVTAHHSCIIIPVFGHIEIGSVEEIAKASEPEPNEAKVVREMREIVSSLTPRNRAETYHDAAAKKEEALQMFKLGILGLEERAVVESLFWKLVRGIADMNRGKKRPPRETKDLGDKIADQYMANFSLFQSAPDHWAFDQLFPIVPLHRMGEAPTRDTTIVDITCDSDGKIDRFIEGEGVDETLSLHALRPGEPYYLGMFMTGAYQDIMGDMHNLFGRVNEIHVFVDDEDPEDFYIEEVIPGDTIEKVLSRVQYEPADLFRRVKAALDQKVKEGAIRPKEGVSLQDFYEAVMKGYTYLGGV